MYRTPYHRKPMPLVVTDYSSRQCTWEYYSFLKKEMVRCPQKCEGRFFCKKHLDMAGKIDSCGYNEYTTGRRTPGGYRI